MQQQSDQESFVTQDSYISIIDRNYFENVSFFSKHFCKPKQIKLNQDRDGEKSVENGLQIVERAEIDDTSPHSRNVEDSAELEIDQDGQQRMRFKHGDGLISMFKHRVKQPIKVRVAICVTVYSEDKEMLKKTLDGIKMNYAEFLNKAGIMSHEIIVVVIYDGIQKMNNENDSIKNMVSLFKQFDLMNGFRRKDYVAAKIKEDGQIDKEIEYLEDDKFQLENYNDDMVFTSQQLMELEDILFENQYTRYIQMCQLIKYINELSKKAIQKLTVSDLPEKIKILFIEGARKYLEQRTSKPPDKDNELLEFIEKNVPRGNIINLMQEAIKTVKNIANNYLSSRQNSAIMYQVALPIDTPNRKQDEEQDPRLRLYQEEPKMYTFFAVKHVNSGKLSSHLWFFEGFCNIIQPDMCVLIDCGLKPADDAIFKMWAHIETFKTTCGGVCGYMALNLENPYDDLGYRTDEFDENNIDCLTEISSYFFDVQKAQMFEYHFAHMLDKPFESCFGYIHVLPGAFSGYNWDALKHEKIKTIKKSGKLISDKQIQKRKKERILRKYLKTVIYNEMLDDIKQANMYLAEDRILCLEIYSKKNNMFNLQYLPDAESRVDPVTSLIRLLGQRKRWINGSWFALQYVLDNRKRVNESNHSNWDKFKFRFNMFYSAFNKALSYVGISIFFIIMHFMIQQFAQNQFLAQIMTSFDLHSEAELNSAKVFYSFFSLRSLVNSLVGIVDFLYILCIGVCIYYSLTLNRHTNTSKRIFNFIASIFGVYGVMSIILVFYNFVSTVISKANGTYQVLDSFIQQTSLLSLDLFIYLLAVIVIIHMIVVLVSFDLRKYMEIVISLPSYFFFVPSYIHLMFIYAFCRIDDLSWGTKGLESDNKKKAEGTTLKFKNEKLRFVFRWISINVSLSLACISLSNDKLFQTALIWSITFYVIIILLLRFTFAMIYLLKYYLFTVRQVNSVTLNQRKKLQRVAVGRAISDKLRQYIEQVKNYNLDEHVQEINEEFKRQSMLSKAIHIEEENIVEEGKSKLLFNNSLNDFNKSIQFQQKKSVEDFGKISDEFTNRKSIQRKSDRTQRYSIDKLPERNSQIRKKREMKVSKNKIYTKVTDTKPILAQIFNSAIQKPTEIIDFQTLKKLTELNNLKDHKKRKFRVMNYNNDKISEQQHEDEQDRPIKDKDSQQQKYQSSPYVK